MASDDRVIGLIRSRIRAALSPYPAPLAERLLAAIEATCFRGYRDEIALFPKRSFEALGCDRPRIAAMVGAAHCLGWTAYRIIDNVADGAGGDIWSGLILHRLAVREYRLCLGRRHMPVLDAVFDAMDAANHREALRETPTAEGIADKSLGHALGLLLPLIHCGHGPDSPAFASASLMMRRLIAARQLSDDVHDWQEDAAAGIRTTVTDPLLPLGERDEEEALLRSLRRACSKIAGHARAAIVLARANRALAEPGYFIGIARRLARPASEFLIEERQERPSPSP